MDLVQEVTYKYMGVNKGAWLQHSQIKENKKRMHSSNEFHSQNRIKFYEKDHC